MAKMIFDTRQLPAVLTVGQVAGLLQCHERKVQNMLASGELKGFKLGPHWRISKAVVLEFVGHVETEAPEPRFVDFGKAQAAVGGRQ